VAISINWATRVITVPQADLTLISGTRYRLDVDAFRLALKDLEDSEDGMSMPDTHSHATQRTLSGVTYARQLEIINGYTVTFQDVGTPYRVECVGANHNIADVQVTNNVSLVIGNSAGLIVVETGVSGLTPEESALLARLVLLEKLLRNKQITNPSTGRMTVFDDDGSTVLLEGNLFEDAAGSVPYRGQGAERRERLT
jgi:hypothetical protein